MPKISRISQLGALLQFSRTGLSTAQIQSKLKISRATVYRYVDDLKDQRYPVGFDRTMGVWRWGKADPTFQREEIPGVRLSAEEAYALFSLFNILRKIDPGFLDEFVSPFAGALKHLISRQGLRTPGLSHKVSVELDAIPSVSPEIFRRISTALMRDHKLNLVLERARPGKGIEVSPQRLVLTPKGWVLWVTQHPGYQPRKIRLRDIANARELPIQAEIDLSLFNRADSTKGD